MPDTFNSFAPTTFEDIVVAMLVVPLPVTSPVSDILWFPVKYLPSKSTVSELRPLLFKVNTPFVVLKLIELT